MFDSIAEVLKKTAEEKPTETLITALVLAGIWAIVEMNSKSS